MAAKKYTYGQKQLANEIHRLRRNILRRVKRLEEKFGETPATKKLRESEYIGDMFSTRNKSYEELEKLKRELERINYMRTSTVKGEKNRRTYAKKAYDKIGELGKDTTDKIKRLYNEFIENNLIYEQYKYTIYDIIEEMISDNKTDDEIREELTEHIDSLLADHGIDVEVDMEDTFDIF